VFYMYKRWWRTSWVVFCVFSSIAEDNDKLKGSSSSCGFFFGLQKMMTSLPTHHHFMSFNFGLQKMMTSLSIHCHLMGFFLGLKKMTTSLPTHCHLMVFSLGYRRWQQIAKLTIDLFFLNCTKQPRAFGSSSSYATFFLSCKKWLWIGGSLSSCGSFLKL
jgi:hypothetical protein